MMPLLGKKSDLTMSEVIVVLLDFESLRQREEDVTGSFSALVTASDWRRRKGSVTFNEIILRDS
jgi:hypothetical protein